MSVERNPQRYKEFARSLGVPLATVGLFAIALGAFTKKQRDAIVFDRDGGKCQFPGDHDCRGGMHCHHIIPQRYGKHVGLDDETIDSEENGLTTCKNIHVGTDPKTIHPDIETARRTYDGTGSSYDKAFQAREDSLDRGEIYWNDSHDRQMHVQAKKLTQEAKKRGWEFPKKRKRKKKA